MKVRLINNTATGPVECVIEALEDGTVEERTRRIGGRGSSPRKAKTTAYPRTMVGTSTEAFVQDLVVRKLSEGYQPDAAGSEHGLDLLHVTHVVRLTRWQELNARLLDAFEVSEAPGGSRPNSSVVDLRIHNVVIRKGIGVSEGSIRLSTVMPRSDAVIPLGFLLALGRSDLQIATDDANESLDASRFVRERAAVFTPRQTELLLELGVLVKQFRWSETQPRKGAFRMAM